jgi:hypothetical protein
MEYIKIHVVPPPSGEICDFCSAKEVFAAYQCGNFIAFGKDTPYVQESSGAWAACYICATLIDNERWDDLTARSAKQLEKDLGFLPAGVKPFLKEVHRLFRLNMRKSA